MRSGLAPLHECAGPGNQNRLAARSSKRCRFSGITGWTPNGQRVRQSTLYAQVSATISLAA